MSTTSAPPGPAELDGETGPHTLLVADSGRHLRRGVARWVGHHLASGSKVLYKAWFDGVPPTGDGAVGEAHWLSGPAGPPGARDALRSGQLEVLDIMSVVQATGGAAEALLDFHVEETRRALDQGWPQVAMSAESPHRPMGEGEAAQLVAHERGISRLVDEWPLTALCQLDVPVEKPTAVWETVAVHHRDVVDGPWSAVTQNGMWCPRGELDAYVVRRFGAALHAAQEEAAGRVDGHDLDLHVDLSEVEFMDVSCAELLVLTAQNGTDGQQMVLHRPTRTVRRLIDAVGRPRRIAYAEAVGT